MCNLFKNCVQTFAGARHLSLSLYVDLFKAARLLSSSAITLEKLKCRSRLPTNEIHFLVGRHEGTCVGRYGMTQHLSDLTSLSRSMDWQNIYLRFDRIFSMHIWLMWCPECDIYFKHILVLMSHTVLTFVTSIQTLLVSDVSCHDGSHN